MNVLIIDDYELIAEGVIKRVKKVLPNANCIFVDNIRMAYASMHQQEIDLIICDLEFEKDPAHDGFFIVQKILELEPRAKVIALTHYNSYRIMKKAKAAGFMSYLNKGCSFTDFSDTIINVLKNGTYQSASEKDLIKKRMAISRTIFNDSLNGIKYLSKRELEITILSAKTIDRNELSTMLGIEPYTIDTHFKNALSKLCLTNRKELIFFALDFKTELKKEFSDREIT